MDLATEYLLRTKSIRDFFHAPCSLCLNRGQNKVLVLMEEIPDSYKITHFFVSDVDGLFPDREVFEIPRNELYSSEKVIVPDHQPLKYHHAPIETKLNTYRSPIGRVAWKQMTNKLLNSQKHRRKRNFWLWKCFSEQILHSKHSRYPKDELEAVYCSEQSYVRRESPKWKVWLDWKDRMLVSGPAASELIFQDCFTSSSSSSSSFWTDTLGQGTWQSAIYL